MLMIALFLLVGTVMGGWGTNTQTVTHVDHGCHESLSRAKGVHRVADQELKQLRVDSERFRKLFLAFYQKCNAENKQIVQTWESRVRKVTEEVSRVETQAQQCGTHIQKLNEKLNQELQQVDTQGQQATETIQKDVQEFETQTRSCTDTFEKVVREFRSKKTIVHQCQTRVQNMQESFSNIERQFEQQRSRFDSQVQEINENFGKVFRKFKNQCGALQQQHISISKQITHIESECSAKESNLMRIKEQWEQKVEEAKRRRAEVQHKTVTKTKTIHVHHGGSWGTSSGRKSRRYINELKSGQRQVSHKTYIVRKASGAQMRSGRSSGYSSGGSSSSSYKSSGGSSYSSGGSGGSSYSSRGSSGSSFGSTGSTGSRYGSWGTN